MRLQPPDVLGILLLLLTTISTVVNKGNPWMCQDSYYKYCKALLPYKCYHSYSRKLCCGTCEKYMLKYSSLLENPKCVYGDKSSRCAKLPLDQCYNKAHRLKCCYTCAIKYRNDAGCEYGDHDHRRCSVIKPYHCYNEEVRSTCCKTCKMYQTGRPECAYGDHRYYTTISSRSSRVYNCRAFIGYFGMYRCKWKYYSTFQRKCCGSCHNEEIKLYRRYYSSYSSYG